MTKYKLRDFLSDFGDGIHGTPNYDDSGEYYFINGNNLENGKIKITEDTSKITKAEYERIKRPLNTQTILLSINGTLGKLAFYNNENIALGKSACYLNIKKGFDKRFFRYLLSTQDFKAYMPRVASGSTIKNFAPSQAADYEFFAPDEKSQQKIAAVLSSLDDKIALNNRINAKLESMAKRLYDYWFVQFDFPNEDGKPYKSSGGKMVWSEELKREIPAGWESGVLSDVANITMGQSPDGFSYNESGEGIVFYQGSADFGIRFPNIRMYTTEPTRLAKEGDILMSVRAPVGALNIANFDCCIGRGLASMNSKIGSIVYLWQLMDNFKNTFDNKNSAGTTFGAITKAELYNLPVIIPSKNVISIFNEKTLSIFNYQLSICKENLKLSAMRDKLLPLLMNGQVVVE